MWQYVYSDCNKTPADRQTVSQPALLTDSGLKNLCRWKIRDLPPTLPAMRVKTVDWTAQSDATKSEGLRERKKRQLRQKLTDTATAMFLERGFEAVRVAEVAAACDVSEKTVFNYFPTKESLVFDREEEQTERLRDALRDRGDGVSIVDSVLAALEGEVSWMYGQWIEAGNSADGLATIRRFSDPIE